VDGTGRNVPAGQFQGSHNKHTGTGANQYRFVCTRCHVDNRSFDHQGGSISMANPINNPSGAYSKGTSFAVSNTFTGGTCSSVYCHSNGTGGTTQSGDTRAIGAVTSLSWGTVNGPGGVGNENYASNCSITCHSGRPSYTNYTGAIAAGKKANAHGYAGRGATHLAQTCDVCHSNITTADGGVTYAFTSYTTHANGRYSIKGSFNYAYNAKVGGTCTSPPTGCHGTAVWGGQLTCVNCHNNTITRTVGRAAGTTLAAVTLEFGNTYGHKKSGRGAVTNMDCIVCHLEGYGYGSANGAGSINTTYHKNGNIDLRDPRGTGEAAITNISGAAFTFQRFSTSYAALSRTSTGHLSNTDIANVVTQKFCLACHRSGGATNTSARNSASGTAYMPWGGVNLGTNYTVLNGAAAAGGVINVFSQMSTGNSSYHPVRGPLNKDFPTPARLIAPYNNFTRAGTSGTKTNGVVINCFDCHNSNAGGLKTLRTISAHGTLAGVTAQVRGTFYATSPTLCTACHSGYTTSPGTSTSHGTGSAMTGGGLDGAENMNTTCHNCHSSQVTVPARPIPAADYHGFNKLISGNNWGTLNARPFGFIRNTVNFVYHRAKQSPDYASGTPTCQGGATQCAGQNGTGTYTVGGTY
jgi:predicted CxxxxCH...CXXCH cytochrome family protein